MLAIPTLERQIPGASWLDGLNKSVSFREKREMLSQKTCDWGEEEPPKDDF